MFLNNKEVFILSYRCSKKVTFFDDLAKQLDKAIEKQSCETLIIIIACAKIGRYQGYFQSQADYFSYI